MELTTIQKTRFWDKVDKSTDGCWNWTGSRNKRGYGRVNLGGKAHLAHRVVATMYLGLGGFTKDSLGAAGEIVLHSCDNTSCVKPDHLSVGTQKENVRDAMQKGRHSLIGWSGENHPRATISEHTARLIRDRLLETGNKITQVSKEFGVSFYIAANIAHRKTWANI